MGGYFWDGSVGRGRFIESCWGNIRERVHWGELGIDGEKILGWICVESVCIGSWMGNRRERDHWGDLGLVGWIILE